MVVVKWVHGNRGQHWAENYICVQVGSHWHLFGQSLGDHLPGLSAVRRTVHQIGVSGRISRIFADDFDIEYLRIGQTRLRPGIASIHGKDDSVSRTALTNLRLGVAIPDAGGCQNHTRVKC
jgi:hypothetical protein